jgi:hypothetical protein
VHTRETWYTDISSAATGQLLQREPPVTYVETYAVDYVNGGWIVTEDQLTPV